MSGAAEVPRRRAGHGGEPGLVAAGEVPRRRGRGRVDPALPGDGAGAQGRLLPRLGRAAERAGAPGGVGLHRGPGHLHLGPPRTHGLGLPAHAVRPPGDLLLLLLLLLLLISIFMIYIITNTTVNITITIRRPSET